MILTLLVIIPLLGGLLSFYLGKISPMLPRWAALSALSVDFILLLILWIKPDAIISTQGGQWIAEVNLEWIPQLGINFHLAMDGLNFLLTLLTVFLGITAVASSWTEIRERIGFFHLNLLAVLSGIIGTFLSLDLFIFYFFWELMLIPMYFLIAIWGHEDRFYASIKFFIFTQASGLIMLVAILGLYFIHGKNTGAYTFDYTQLLGTTLSPAAEMWLMLGFLIAFAVKLPVIPIHTWLPDAHTEAPTAGSVILAGLLLKTGAYGMIRFIIPLFPHASSVIAPVIFTLAAAGILYGALVAFGQTDLKRLIAYTSVSHMGFVLLGVFMFNDIALKGAVLQMLCHGVSTGALFIIAGALQERMHTREMARMGGLWATTPRIGAVMLFFALASLGLPGLGNFIAEFLVLLGSFGANKTVASIASVGLILAMSYSLWMMQRVFHGPNEFNWSLADFKTREMAVMAAMVAIILWLGVYPQPVLDRLGNMQTGPQSLSASVKETR
ncbi:MAG: NADH-quinone oxidoreductase subunit M [Deltaproteobacteria bacterium]|nr:NADH-quinone oxidoreductase subunit M [Deltaproteobacteria bacterium]